MKRTYSLFALLMAVCLSLCACADATVTTSSSVTSDTIPVYAGVAYVTVDENQPGFTQEDYTTESFETYSDLDSLGRCGVAYACVGQDLMPTEKRGDIGQVKPSGWQTVRYDGVVEGNYLYNRCHLIGYQLSGENANEKNLITGTRYLNTTGMLPFENQVADYVTSTGNHVLYRVTPVFEGNDLLAQGVQMEAWSVEDDGAGVCFNVFVYNVQPGITIDYATGDSWLTQEGDTTTSSGTTDSIDITVPAAEGEGDTTSSSQETTYILNTSTKKFHLADCASATSTQSNNRAEYTGDRQDLIDQGYAPCGRCKP